MSDTGTPVGTIAWHDLTVDDADTIRDFYSAVVGWKPDPLRMGDYADYNMLASDGQGAAGVYWAKGPNADIPPVWLVYITVTDLDVSVAKCVDLGGRVVSGPRDLGPGGRFCVIRDPAGAVSALYESRQTSG